MRLVFNTQVNQPVPAVFAGFTKELFLRLSPPFPPVSLERFDGMKIGDEVHLVLKFPGRHQRWVSRITDRFVSDTECWFEDEGVTLPFFLKTWRHRHIIRQAGDGDGSVILDDVTFTSPHPVFDPFLYPAMLLQFWYRKPIYKRAFRHR